MKNAEKLSPNHDGPRVFLRLALGLALVLWAAHGDAEPAFDWKPTATLVSGQAFDVWTTTRALDRGCHEGNPLYGSRTPSTGRLLAGKAITIGPVAVAASLLQAMGHPKLAAMFGYGGGAVGFGVGAANLARCGGGR